MRRGLASLLVFLSTVPFGLAQTNNATPTNNAVPGLQLAPVPPVLNAQVPKLPRGQGLIVEQIGADLPKTLGKLSRFDVLLSYDGHPINSIEQFNQLVLNAKPDQKRPLVVLRGGKEVKLEVNLHASELKGAIKPGGPPAVSMECTFLDGGKMQIQMQYYSESSSKLETVTCNGSLPEIEQQVRNHKLPSRVEDLVDVALKRLKAANVK